MTASGRTSVQESSPRKVVEHFPGLGRRTVVRLLKCPVKGRETGEAGLHGYVHDRQVGILRQRCFSLPSLSNRL